MGMGSQRAEIWCLRFNQRPNFTDIGDQRSDIRKLHITLGGFQCQSMDWIHSMRESSSQISVIGKLASGEILDRSSLIADRLSSDIWYLTSGIRSPHLIL